jgi:asparagine synthase (glutamine-hydrolysing)
VSAIFGVHSLDRRPVDATVVARMGETLAHRGLTADVWCNDQVGFGHRLLSAPPNAQDQIVSLRSESLVITADARLDNRAHLYDLLQVAPAERLVTSDSHLILLAYERWGESCVEKLLGDFAFVLWDAQQQVLFCARDHVGVKPFYCTVCNATFYWASEIKALRAAVNTPLRPNEAQVGMYLAGFADEAETTFFEGVYRLPAAHAITVSSAQVTCRRYWRLDWQTELKLSSNQAYAEAFLHLFREAVNCRLPYSGDVGAFLSGGLDSSSVACLAELTLRDRNVPLHTFTTVYDTVTACDERQYSNQVLAQGNFVAHSLTGDAHSPLADLERMLYHADEPFFAPGLSGAWQRLRAAGDQGIRVIFEGHGGDELLFCTARNRLHELARKHQWLTFGQELHAVVPLMHAKAWQVAWPYIYHYALGRRPSKRVSDKDPRGSHSSRRSEEALRSSSALLNADFARQIGLANRYTAWQESRPLPNADARFEHGAVLSNPGQATALELLGKVASAHRVDLVFPLLDKRLLEFCLSLPSAQKFSQNWDRIVLRRAMKEILPAEIQWRREKTEFSKSVAQTLFSFADDRFEAVFRSPCARTAQYVNTEKAEALYAEFTTKQGDVSIEVLSPLLRVAILDCWLRDALPVSSFVA